jgi:hypothetical protein
MQLFMHPRLIQGAVVSSLATEPMGAIDARLRALICYVDQPNPQSDLIPGIQRQDCRGTPCFRQPPES